MNPIPYGFTPIDPSCSVHDAPLWRDGSSTEPRLSGELLISLTALTPLIVGNHQHQIDEQHSLLVPQMLNDGRVLIGGASLKGMLRAALSRLLQAPMEKVTEHHYTYRPNLSFGPKLEQRAAVVQAIEGEGDTAKITIRLLRRDCQVVFVREEARKLLGEPAVLTHIKRTIRGVELTSNTNGMRQNTYSMRLNKSKNPARQETLDHYFLSYRGGIDGKGLLAKAFKTSSDVYQAVLVPADQYQEAKTLSIPSEVWKAYLKTQQILANSQYGHLSPGYPNLNKLEDIKEVQDAILKNKDLEEGQLIYVEVESGKLTITSMGHHFQYRWGYSSSVRYKNRLLDGKGQLRAELALHPQEQADEQGAPRQLTGARLLFGYTIDGRDEAQAGLAEHNFKRLAGRITFNTAIEDPADKTPEKRFIDGGQEIQLRILGMPRPSAVEFYLKQTKQPKKLLTTYGDLPNDPGGDLAGRKFYRHQPDARMQHNLYAPSQEEKSFDANAAARGNCVRYLSHPGSRFRCTLRFDSLRPWELGALLATIDPSLLAATFGKPKNQYGYAHKLGYGKPLGLGSVRLKVDAARWQTNDDWNWQQSKTDESSWQALQAQALDALKAKLLSAWQNEKARDLHITNWLEAHQWNQKGRAEYPEDSKGNIFGYHTNLRRNHAAVRRGVDVEKNFKKFQRT